MRIKRVGVWSLTKVVTTLSVFYGMFVGFFYGWMGSLFTGAWGLQNGASSSELLATQWATVGGGVVIGGLSGAVGGLFAGVTLALLVNLALILSRGLELEVEAPELQPLPPRAVAS